MDCQDWSEVKIGGGKIYNNKNKELPINIKQNNIQNLPGTKFLKKLEEDETVVIPKVSISVSKEIENKRNLCSITQKELANALNIPVNIGPLSQQHLSGCFEVFATSTAGGIMPITRIDGINIGDGKLGKVTKKIYNKYWDAHDNSLYSSCV